MKLKRPMYVKAMIDRHGHSRCYFNRPGYKPTPLPGLPWSPEFMAAHSAAMGEKRAPVINAKAGSFEALAKSYLASPSYRGMQARTQRVYSNAIERWCKTEHKGVLVGTLSAKTLQDHHIEDMMAAMADRPEAANLLLKIIRAMMKHATSGKKPLRHDDPTVGIKQLRKTDENGKPDNSGFHSWTEAEIEQFEARHAIGTKARLAFALMLCTAQRRSDVIRMGRQDVDKNGAIHVRQLKTGAELFIPMHSALRAIIDAEQPAANVVPLAKTFLVTEFGKPFTSNGFGNWMRKRCDEAGLPQCSAHGLRKAAARRLAEAGCTTHEIAAITGHKSLKEIERYTKAAAQKRLAVSAMNKTETGTFNPEPRVERKVRK
jgi:integrase